MSIRNLDCLFKPRSIAVVGATNRENAAGFRFMHNLLASRFPGPVMPVNPKHCAVAGVLCYPDIASLPLTPDLAILCIANAAVVDQVIALAQRGCRAAIVFSADFEEHRTEASIHLREHLQEVAKRYGIRILGPSSLGVMAPNFHLDASPLYAPPLPGTLAFVSQSVSMASLVVDWSRTKGIGFSHLVSLGEACDIGFGDLLDYLAGDPGTRAILLYIESIRQRRDFMSAARAAARNKPVLAIKSGRAWEGARAAKTHTGALAGSDAVYDAAFTRAGMLRVNELEEMFAAAETLARTPLPRSPSLGILTNGGGIAVIAADELGRCGGTLAHLSDETSNALDQLLDRSWSHSNPVDIHSYASLDHYAKAAETLMSSKEIGSLLVMHAPTSLESPESIAAELVRISTEHRYKTMMTCFVGGERVEPARKLLRESGLPAYETPHGAIQAFTHLIRYRHNQEMLMETPAAAPTPDGAVEKAHATVEAARAAGRTTLGEDEARQVLAAYGIPFVESATAKTPAEAGRAAERFGGRVALKVISPDIVHKSDYRGVVLNLAGAEAVEREARRLAARMAETHPEVAIEGFAVQRMVERRHATELIVGVTTDPVFGPVVMFGQGGTSVDVVGDTAIGLPPLNTNLARSMVQQTRVAALLSGYRDHPAANLDAVCSTLIMVGQLVADIPEITELDINPFFADADGVIAVDCRIQLAEPGAPRQHLAIRAYPRQLEEVVTLRDGSKVLLRPIRPEDEPNHHRFIAAMSPEDIRFRFFSALQALPHTEMARLTQIDYDRDMAFIAETIDTEQPETVGVVRAMNSPDNDRAEFAVVVLPDQKGNGLARALMIKLIDYCRSRGTGELVGPVLTENKRMLHFVEGLGFKRGKYVDHDVVEMVLDLKAENAALAADNPSRLS